MFDTKDSNEDGRSHVRHVWLFTVLQSSFIDRISVNHYDTVWERNRTVLPIPILNFLIHLALRSQPVICMSYSQLGSGVTVGMLEEQKSVMLRM